MDAKSDRFPGGVLRAGFEERSPATAWKLSRDMKLSEDCLLGTKKDATTGQQHKTFA